MDTLNRRRRALTSLTVSLSALAVTAGSLGCSSNGSGFDMGMGGSGTTNPTSAMGGTGVTNPTAAMGGSNTNPTSAMGGNGTTGGSGQTGGDGTTGGSGPQGGSGSGGSSGGASDMPCGPGKAVGEICHEFIANDNGRNQVNYVNEFTSKNPGGVVWAKPVGVTGQNSPRTIEIVENATAAGGKAVLVSVDNGYVELGLQDGAKVAQVTVNFTGITGACRMPDGNTALGTNAAIRIVGPNGAQVRQFNLPAGPELRAINRNPTTGNFWFSKTESVYEVSDQGQQLWDANMGAGTKGYAVWWRADGGAYATTGDPSTVIELDKDGQIKSTIGGDGMTFTYLGKTDTVVLDFFSGFVRMPDSGNYVVANWLGHLTQPGANTAHIVEFTPLNTVAWAWGDQTLARQITNVYVFR